MRNTLITTFTISLLALSGCGKQDYSDPEAFFKQYGQELISKTLGPEKEWLGFDHFKFADFKIGIDPFKGEFVSAFVSVVPKKGMKYHRLADPKLKYADCSLPGDDPWHKYIDEKTWWVLYQVGEQLNHGEYCPIIYDPNELNTKEMFGDLGRVRIYRDKDSSDILRPVSSSEAIAFYESQDRDEKYKCSGGLRRRFNYKSIGNEEYLKKHRAVPCPFGVPEIPENVKNTISTYNIHVANITNAFLEIRNAVRDIRNMETYDNSSPNDNIRSNWILSKVNMERKSADATYKESVRVARRDLDKAMEEAKAYEGNIVYINRSLQKAKQHLAGAESSYEATKQRYEARLAKQNQKSRRDTQLEKAESQLPAKEAQLAKYREKVAEIERQLQEVQTKLAVEKAKAASLEPVVNDEIAKAKAVFDDATTGLEETWSARYAEELASAKARLERNIKTILSEVEVMEKAIGNGK